MKNRLQFRHCTRIFNSKDEIKSHLVGLFNNDNSPLKPAIAAEPLVLYYQESGDTQVNAVLAIGRPTSDEEYFLIDVAGIQKDLEILTDEVFNLADVSDKLDQEIQDRISGDTRLEGMIEDLDEHIGNILKRICESAGFNDDGEDMGKYDDIAHDATHYIVSAANLANADVLLDEAIWQNHVEIVHAVETLKDNLKVSLERNVSARTLISYDLLQGGEVVGKIEIPSDRSISSGQLMRNDNGQWIIRFVVVNENGSPIDSFDVDVENLEDIYVGGEGITVSGNVISADFAGILDGLDSVVSGSSNGFELIITQNDGKLSSVHIDAPNYVGLIASGVSEAKEYANTVGQMVLENANEYTDSKITSIYRVKGSKEYFADLAEIEDPQVGDVWNVENEYRYSGNTGEIKIYHAGTNYVYVQDEYAAIGRWDPLGGQTVDMNLYLTKEEFMSYSTASTAALNAKIDLVNDRVTELSAGTISEVERLDERIDAIKYSGDTYVDVDNRDKFISISGHVITRLADLELVNEPGQYLVDAYLVKQMKAELEELIAESVNEAKVKKIVAEMLVGTAQEIGITMLNNSGETTTVSTEANTLQIGFADDAYFQADLPEEP